MATFGQPKTVKTVKTAKLILAYSDDSIEYWDVDIAGGGGVLIEQDLDTTRQELAYYNSGAFLPTHYRNIKIEVTNAVKITRVTPGKEDAQLTEQTVEQAEQAQIKVDQKKLAKLIKEQISNVDLDADPPEEFLKRFGIGKYANIS